jgi:hypothetical protein
MKKERLAGERTTPLDGQNFNLQLVFSACDSCRDPLILLLLLHASHAITQALLLSLSQDGSVSV